MTFGTFEYFTEFIDIILVILGISLALTFARLVIGPTLPDRVIALDLIGIITAGMIAVLSIEYDEPVYLIVSVVLALIAFIGTIAFAYYIAKGGAE